MVNEMLIWIFNDLPLEMLIWIFNGLPLDLSKLTSFDRIHQYITKKLKNQL